jgi:hypothetical protein
VFLGKPKFLDVYLSDVHMVYVPQVDNPTSLENIETKVSICLSLELPRGGGDRRSLILDTYPNPKVA